MSAEEKEDSDFFGKTRGQVLRYLDHCGVSYRSVPQKPDWYLAPHVSIWPVFGVVGGDRPGWFAIAGNLPTDYVNNAESLTGRDSNARARLAALAPQCDQ